MHNVERSAIFGDSGNMLPRADIFKTLRLIKQGDTGIFFARDRDIQHEERPGFDIKNITGQRFYLVPIEPADITAGKSGILPVQELPDKSMVIKTGCKIKRIPGTLALVITVDQNSGMRHRLDKTGLVQRVVIVV